jgi:hypothetical protein
MTAFLFHEKSGEVNGQWNMLTQRLEIARDFRATSLVAGTCSENGI